jgi:predicted RNA binding protein YcfA (HicA-like mRNA interferase family)
VSRLPSITGKQVIAALKKLGFEEVRIRGSHHYLRHPDGRVTVVAAHAGETVGPGLLSKILRDTKVSKAQLSKKL